MGRLWIWLSVLVLASAQIGVAETRVAIIDTAFDTRPFLDQLQRNGVQVIGRYYARCAQPESGNWARAKRLIDQGDMRDGRSEISEISRRGMAILSIYQYYSNHPNKYLGQTKDGKALPDESCNWGAARPRTPSEEARLDARAAISQARALGQPSGTAIYFGVDFRLDEDDRATQSSLLSYFTTLHREIRGAGYRLGAYGSGLSLSLLQNDGLIDHAWIMASSSFPGSSAFHRSLKWNLFQNEVNQEWFGEPRGGATCSHGMPVDTNVQNPSLGNDIGFWQPGRGAYAVPARRTNDVFNTRRLACNGDAIVREAVTSHQSDLTTAQMCQSGKRQSVGTQIPYVTSVRVNPTNATSKLIQVDVNDDGTWDGWTWTGNLTPGYRNKPEYIFAKGARDAASCR